MPNHSLPILNDQPKAWTSKPWMTELVALAVQQCGGDPASVKVTKDKAEFTGPPSAATKYAAFPRKDHPIELVWKRAKGKDSKGLLQVAAEFVSEANAQPRKGQKPASLDAPAASAQPAPDSTPAEPEPVSA